MIAKTASYAVVPIVRPIKNPSSQATFFAQEEKQIYQLRLQVAYVPIAQFSKNMALTKCTTALAENQQTSNSYRKNKRVFG